MMDKANICVFCETIREKYREFEEFHYKKRWSANTGAKLMFVN